MNLLLKKIADFIYYYGLQGAMMASFHGAYEETVPEILQNKIDGILNSRM